MDTGTKTYQVDKHKQLIPLNGSMVNFTCFFEVKSKDKKPFNLAIVEQGEMKPKQFKLVEDGYINGQLDSDGQLKTYFLVLKAPQPCECDVRVVNKPKELPSNGGISQPSQDVPPNGMGPAPHSSHPSQGGHFGTPLHNEGTSQPRSLFQMKYIIGISAVLIILFLLYKYRKPIFKKLESFKEKDILTYSSLNTSF